eukprot:366318-Chlamydomonas_euryale.AAC.17
MTFFAAKAACSREAPGPPITDQGTYYRPGDLLQTRGPRRKCSNLACLQPLCASARLGATCMHAPAAGAQLSSSRRPGADSSRACEWPGSRSTGKMNRMSASASARCIASNSLPCGWSRLTSACASSCFPACECVGKSQSVRYVMPAGRWAARRAMHAKRCWPAHESSHASIHACMVVCIHRHALHEDVLKYLGNQIEPAGLKIVVSKYTLEEIREALVEKSP